ncbi:hypothetical protein ACWG0P_07035 [Amedibacillus sp. YH-ame6]
MKKVTFEQVRDIFNRHNEINGTNRKSNVNVLKAVVVFSSDSFEDEYTETERSYEIRSDAKMFNADMISNSLFGNCLDGKDMGVRLDHYMYDGWKIEYCYVVTPLGELL